MQADVNTISNDPLALLFALVAILLIVVIPIATAIKKRIDFQNSEYYLTTSNEYDDLLYDKGKAGEYHTFECLNKLDGMKRFIFNCYIPKSDGTTTEIDVIMIHEKGIFVFESKNYKGWIFGKETDNYWTQCLKGSRGSSNKYRFYNPIKQNASHIKWLQRYLNIPEERFHSYIVFSNNCEFKNVTLSSGNVYVLKQSAIYSYIGSHIKNLDKVYTGEEIDEIYNKLYVHTLKTEAEKAEHIKQIKNPKGQNAVEALDANNNTDEEQFEKVNSDIVEDYCSQARKIVGGEFAKRYKNQLVKLSEDSDFLLAVERLHSLLPENEFGNESTVSQVVQSVIKEYDNCIDDKSFITVEEIKKDFLANNGDNINSLNTVKIKLYFSVRAINVKKTKMIKVS